MKINPKGFSYNIAFMTCNLVSCAMFLFCHNLRWASFTGAISFYYFWCAFHGGI